MTGTGENQRDSIRDITEGYGSGPHQRVRALIDHQGVPLDQYSPEELRGIMHDLYVHQIELELQNEELRITRHSLERTKAEFENLYDFAPIGYMTISSECRIQRSNLKAAEYLGRSRDELTGMTLVDFIHCDDRQQFVEENRRTVASGADHICQLRVVNGDGEVRHVHFECRQAVINGHENRLLWVTLTDISQIQQLKEELITGKERLSLALEASECGLWDWPDINQDLCWWSPETYMLLGFEPGEVRSGLNLFMSLVHPGHRDSLRQAIDAHTCYGHPFDLELQVRHRDRGYRWFQVLGRLIGADADHARHMAGLIKDVTSHHETNAALQAAKQQAEQANLDKGRYLAAASHDLRQPLQSVMMYLATLKLAGKAVDTEAILDRMETSLHSMEDLLRTLLNISQLEAGIIEPVSDTFLLNDLLEDMKATLQPIAARKGLQLRTHRRNTRISGDRVLLMEILLNLVGNAIKNTDQGGILVGCRHRDGHVLLQVWDTGIGMDHELLRQLLQPSDDVMLSKERIARASGVEVRWGLGLSIVKQICGLLGYSLAADSRPGLGSVFMIDLGDCMAGDIVPDDQVVCKENTPVLQAISLLVIDDDTAILDAFSTMFNSLGYKVCCVVSRDEAISLIRSGYRPNLVICDLRLRRSNGIQVIKEIRTILHHMIPVLFITGDTSTRTWRGHGLPRSRILYKPVDFESLRAVIAQLLSAADGSLQLSVPDGPSRALRP